MNKRILVVSAGLLALVVFAMGVFFYTQQQTQQAAQLAQDLSLIHISEPTRPY